MSNRNDPNLPPNQPSNQGRHARGGRNADFQKSYQMNEEEKRILLQCQSESFWYRALPLALGAGLLTQTLITRGTITTGTRFGRFGSLPKVAFGSIIGYMAGKISYVNTCKEKFLRLENSPIGEMLRKGGGMPSGQGGSFGLQLPGFQSSNDDPVEGTSSPQSNSDSYSSFNANDDYRANIDIDTSNVKTMDNHFDFELNNDADPELEAKRPEMTKTYEDLRRENRQHHPSQYTQVMPGHYQPRPQTRPQEPKVKKEKELPFSSGAIKKNKYGDEME
ncbi:OCIA domain-containing protein 1-like [Asterias rubens]|uniref:OCIA domain-containing protein 1-like n=1 Tax=Asterias rubens TaxID=7604 RepID=UPI001455525D|nr:OCIA domain-containing protein 1-like [Asterias rubens]